MLESLFNKVADLQTHYFIKMRLQHRYFLVNFVKFLRIPFFTEQLRWLSLKSILHWIEDANWMCVNWIKLHKVFERRSGILAVPQEVFQKKLFRELLSVKKISFYWYQYGRKVGPSPVNPWNFGTPEIPGDSLESQDPRKSRK